MANKKIKMTFEIDLAFSEDIETQKEQKEDVKAMKEYITNHLLELEDHHNYGTKIVGVKVFKKTKKNV